MEILSPKAPVKAKAPIEALHLSILSGTPIAIIDDSKPKFDIFVNALLDQLVKLYGVVPGLRFEKPAAGRYSPDAWYDAICEQGGAAIVGWGDCGGCSTYSFLDAGELIRRGIPSLAVISDAFTTIVQFLAVREGMQSVPLLVLPHPPTDLSDEDLVALGRSRAPEVAELLTGAPVVVAAADLVGQPS